MWWHGILLVIARILLWTWRPPPRKYIYVAAVSLAVIVVVVGMERLGLWPKDWKTNQPVSILSVAGTLH